ncbi:MAG: type II secretion system protein N [Mariprofundales bacterium]|nr:type II secretion system protein N [Mariprofundales bacterium]
MLLAWQVAPLFVSSVPTTVYAPPEKALAGSSIPDLATLISLPLFGVNTVVVRKTPVVAVVAAVTHLNIRLLGTVVAGARSLAVLQMNGGKDKVIFIGQPLQPGVVLKRVEIYAVVVDNHGHLERITMKNHSIQPTRGRAVAAPIIRHIFTRQAIQHQMQDMSKLLTGALAVPHQSNGVADGFLIQSIVPNSLYAQAGLKNGDVIRSVNGKPVTTLQQGIELFQKLRNANSVNIDITRSGTPKQLYFEIH